MPVELDVPDLPEGVRSVTINEQKVFDGLRFPLILRPAGNFKDKDSQFWNDWVKNNLKAIETLLLRYGAILFRGFPLDTPNDFDEFAKAYGYKQFPYSGASIRTNIVGNVYTTNESPPGKLIPMHHDMVAVKDYPHLLFFYCDIPAKEGGDTPIALSNVIYQKMAELEPEFVSRLEKEGLRYVRSAPDGDDMGSAFGRSWQSIFFTSDKEEAEKKAKASGYDIEWLDDGSMKTITEVLPAIRVDKRTGKKSWFNAVYASYLALEDVRNDRTKTVIFPNDDTINAETIETLKQVTEEASVSFKWLHKDAVLIDNRTVQHARGDFFVPPRRILISTFQDHQGPL